MIKQGFNLLTKTAATPAHQML